MKYIHLQVQSAYSLLNSACKIDLLVKKAAELGFSALALTDENVMYGAVSFYKACKRYRVKPIIGLTLSVQSDENINSEESYPLVLLARNNEGYRHLLKLSSLVQTKYELGVPKTFLEKYRSGIIAISPFKGEINQYLLNGESTQAEKVVSFYKKLYEDNFFVSMEHHGLSLEEKINQSILPFLDNNGIKPVVTNDVHYIEKKDASAYECLVAIKDGVLLSDQRLKNKSPEYYLKSEEEMMELFKFAPHALDNTVRIAESCTVDLKLGNQTLPKYPLPESMTSSQLLKQLCEKGVKERYEDPTEKVIKRLEYELSVINKMNFNDYFLIVWDFMKFAHDNRILTGPGRGSAAGSLVAYVLKITDVDPIEHELLFERFLNPERITMPDIDIDFSDIHRDKVIKYVSQKYGRGHVAQIITFGTLAAKASVRDVGRVMGIETNQIDHISKLISSRPGTGLKNAVNESSVLKKMITESDEVKKLFEIALKIEGLPRHTSTHAAGVVISDTHLTNVTPIQEGHEGVLLTQYPMDNLEELGLLKMDFLGLRNLTLIENICGMIERKHGIAVNLNEIPFDDGPTFDLLSKGDTTGIFQLESEGMRKVLQRLIPSRFEDIVAVNALYRPGPMENIPVYIERKHGKRGVEYPHEDLRPILEKTYGVIVYQEQIMQIASKMAGFTLGEADILRRAVSKKKRDILDQERMHFEKGCIKNGYSAETANNIYDLIVRFADYGFNRSHAVAYSMISYKLAYLKANFPLFFISAILTSVIGNDNKIASYIREAKQKNIKVLPPSINHSHYPFDVEGDSIRYSLGAIKNVGISALKEIIKHQKQKRFVDLFDFCSRVSLKIINRRVLESLIMAGCFDEFKKDRAVLLASVDVAFEYAELVSEDTDGLFLGDDLIPKPEYVEVEAIGTNDKITFEKEVLGLFLSSHPIEPYKNSLKSIGALSIMDLQSLKDKTTVTLGGYVSSVKVIKTKKGDQMAFLMLSDETGEIDTVIFPKVYNQYMMRLQKESLFYIRGALDSRDGKRQLIVEELQPLLNIQQQTDQQLYIKIEEHQETSGVIFEVKKILKQYKGFSRVLIYYSDKKSTISLSNGWNVDPSEECLEQLKDLLGNKNVVLKSSSLQ